jgi:serine protease Do
MDRQKNSLWIRRFRYPALVAGALVFLVAGMLIASSAGPAGHVYASPKITPVESSGPPSFADLAEALGPSVVNVKITKLEKTQFPNQFPFDEGPFGEMFKKFFGEGGPGQPREFRRQGAGSGVIIDGDGTILTNNHVVEGAQEITVTLSDKREFKAHVIGRDPKTDLAVIRLEGKGQFQAARLGDSETLRVGEWVLAEGNPFGLSNTVTAGIVSAKGRIIGAGPYDDFIQTDAPINPGNSGGPLFNMRGEVVGIATAIIPNGQGIGFAIPINTAKTLLPELVSKGSVTRGYLGVNIQNITDDLASSLNLKSKKGALVSEVVQGGPAEKAGVNRGDVIVACDGKEIVDSHELASFVASLPVGKQVSLRVIRDGKEMTLNVKIASLNAHEGVGEKAENEEASPGKWGLQLQDLSPEAARRAGLKSDQGSVVAAVRPGSPAEESAVQAGDIILEVNRQPVKGAEDTQAKMAKLGDKGQALLLIQRGKSTFYLVLKG